MKNNKPYKKYRPSEIDWLGDIPKHWEVKRIKYIFKEQDKRSEEGLEDLLSVSHYTGVTKKSDRYKEGEEISNAKSLVGYKIVSEGDLVMNIMLAWNGSLGISKFNGITSPAYCVFKSLIGGERYFGYLFRTKNAQQEFKKQSTGIIESRLRLYPDKFFNIKTVVPPKEEQEKIANFLDYKTAKIDRFIHKKKLLIKLLNEQKDSIINEVIKKGLDSNVKMKSSGNEWLGDIPEHWNWTYLRRVVKVYSGGTPSKEIKSYWENGTIPWLASGEVNKRKIFNAELFITNEGFNNSSAKWIPKGSIIIALAGQGKTKGMVASIENDMTGNQSLAAVIPNASLINYHYLRYYLQSKYKKIRGFVGDLRDGLNLNHIKSIPISIIPLNEQLDIVFNIEAETAKLDKTIASIEKEITLVQEYKTALIAEAVTGKIDIRDFDIPNFKEDIIYDDIEDEEVLDMVAEDGEAMEIE